VFKRKRHATSIFERCKVSQRVWNT